MPVLTVSFVFVRVHFLASFTNSIFNDVAFRSGVAPKEWERLHLVHGLDPEKLIAVPAPNIYKRSPRYRADGGGVFDPCVVCIHHSHSP